MPNYGTAPRKINGVWVTRTGRRLNAAGQRYWEAKAKSGQFDTAGHRISHPQFTKASPRAKAPNTTLSSASTFMLPGQMQKPHLTAIQKRQQAIYENSKHATAEAKAAVNQAIRARFAGIEETAARATKTLNPVAGATLEALSPLTATQETIAALGQAHLGQAGLAAMGIFPFLPGRAARVPKVVRAAEKAAEAEKTLPVEKQVLKATAEARKTYGQQKKLHSAERARRASKLEPAFEKAGGGMEGYRAGLRHLKGELPKLRFDNLAEVDDSTMDHLLTLVQQHSDLRPYEKISLQSALLRAREGHVPRTFEIKLVERAFGTEKARELAGMSVGRKLLRGAGEVVNLPRSILASFDVSAPFRQGLLAGAHSPRTLAKNLGPMFKMLVSEKRYGQVMQEITERPTYQTMLDANLKLTDLGDLTAREEQFMSNLAEKITGGKHGFVRASSRAYTGFLNRMRADLFDSLTNDLADAAIEQGISPERLRRDIAKFVNTATGRGDLGPLEGSAVVLNTLLFSPRLFASRIATFNPVFYAQLNPVVRKQALRATSKLVAGGSTMLGIAALAGAKVVTDPRNADWGKIKVGNTRFDIWGGHQQIARLMSQIASGQIVSSTTGKTLRLKGNVDLSRQDIVKRFFEGKLAPTPSLVNDWFRGTDFADRPFSWKRAVVSRSYPLLIQDALDIYHGTGSPWKALGGYGIGAFGIGVQTYGQRKKKPQAADDPYGSLFTPGTGSSEADPYASLFAGP